MQDVASFISLPLAVKSVKIPVIAAGGVGDGRGFLGALAMGAEGVLLGSRFLATKECPVHDDVKDRFVRAKAEETALIMKSIGNPMRTHPQPIGRRSPCHRGQGDDAGGDFNICFRPAHKIGLYGW